MYFWHPNNFNYVTAILVLIRKLEKMYVKINRSGKNCLETSFQCVIDLTVGILCVQCTYSDLICMR